MNRRSCRRDWLPNQLKPLPAMQLSRADCSCCSACRAARRLLLKPFGVGGGRVVAVADEAGQGGLGQRQPAARVVQQAVGRLHETGVPLLGQLHRGQFQRLGHTCSCAGGPSERRASGCRCPASRGRASGPGAPTPPDRPARSSAAIVPRCWPAAASAPRRLAFLGMAAASLTRRDRLSGSSSGSARSAPEPPPVKRLLLPAKDLP